LLSLDPIKVLKGAGGFSWLLFMTEIRPKKIKEDFSIDNGSSGTAGGIF